MSVAPRPEIEKAGNLDAISPDIIALAQPGGLGLDLRIEVGELLFPVRAIAPALPCFAALGLVVLLKKQQLPVLRCRIRLCDETNVTPFRSNTSTSLAKSASERLRRSIL